MTSTATATVTHSCTCTSCKGEKAFTAPADYISGTPKAVRDMVHNYGYMVRNPVHGPILARRGLSVA